MNIKTKYRSNPKLTLVGAGPGDPELITVKGLNAIKNAKVILYDALIHPDLLNQVSARSIKIFVGKRAGMKSYDQHEINRLIIKYGREYGDVIRLKGGDPFIFGRGQEEIEYAFIHGLEIQVIPGLSSSTALTSLQQIPLTTRGLTRSFWVLTGTTKTQELSKDIRLAVNSSATVVILMGRNKLPEIVKLYQNEGKGELPVALIQNGSLNNERIALGTVNTIEREVERREIGTPAIIVLGQTVGMHPEFISQYVQQNLRTVSKLN